MPNYQNGKVYKLWPDQSDCMYIGSTTVNLAKRLSKHKQNTKVQKYITYQEMSEHTNIRIELIELFPCNTKEELLAREGYYIRLYREQVLNKVIPDRKRKEYIEDNKDKIKLQTAKRYEANKDAHSTRWAKYYKANIDKIKERKAEYRKNNKDKIKAEWSQYYVKNKETLDKKSRDYLANNREAINAKGRERRAKLREKKVSELETTTD